MAQPGRSAEQSYPTAADIHHNWITLWEGVATSRDSFRRGATTEDEAIG